MKLHHFTSAMHFRLIRAAGSIHTTESNLNMLGEGPRVVWLSDSDNRELQGGWSSGSVLDKTDMRISVEVPDNEAHPWKEWARARNIEWWWEEALIRAGGGEDAAKTWYVIERDIPRAEWRAITMRTTLGTEVKIDAEERDVTTSHG